MTTRPNAAERAAATAAERAAATAAAEPAPTPEVDKSALVAEVMSRHGLPSYEAWALSIDALSELLGDAVPTTEEA